ncbi:MULTISPECIES: substrate-binding domain-containing protein [Agrobacterium]|uniref:Substrate-binding domain-containing protein n=1 Tax=Agrobacterium burrii TaxID=2815339 RepID=A0ABS3ENJ2_9HYPH|nr:MULTISPECIES: substrate-binding domain-containing protein [Agrobacterium]MBO0133553.1 substrate-binding domain-containing protein [Agrobacterium burrii]MQB12196.1 sugar ABC transporter substrate-binding protein [Agrobacterium sp. ICMP 6402]NTZ93496.1 sugar ABC transporter substrate-binding protein [Agrobacterium tumefaciens]
MKLIRHVALLAAAACAGATTVAAQEDLKVGAIYMDAQGFYAGVRKGIQSGAAEAGRKLDVVETNAQGDVSKESSFIDSLISAGVQAIIISPVSADGSYRAIRRAHDAGIPVVCYNTCLNDAEMKEYISAYAVGDPFDFGRKLGDAAADYFIAQKNEAPKIAVLNCEFVEVCVTRRKGFEEALQAKVPGAKIVANQEGAILDKAVSVASTMLSSNPDIDAFFGEAGGATLGAARAVKSQGKTGKVVVFGGDMTTEIAQELADFSVIKAVVDISGQGLGRLALAQAIKSIDGQPPEGIKVAYDIDLYKSSEDGKGWLKAHADGIP